MLPLGRVRPNQANSYCDGQKQNGVPQILSYVSTDAKNWEFLGVPWHGETENWGPRIECPYQFNIGNTTVLKMSAPGGAKHGSDWYMTGSLTGNGSTFVPTVSTAAGHPTTFAFAVLAHATASVTPSVPGLV